MRELGTNGVMKQPSRRLRAFAILASFGLHVVALWLWGHAERPLAGSSARTLEMVTWEEPSPPAAQEPPKPSPVKPTRNQVPKRVAQADPRPAPAPAEPALPTPERAAPADAPKRAMVLVPPVDLGSGGVLVESPTGRTLFNDGGVEDLVAKRAVEGERARKYVDGFAKDVLASARVERGLVDPAYGELRRRLANAISKVPDAINPQDAREKTAAFFDQWKASRERYGKTGAPYETPEGWRADSEIPPPLQAAVDRGSPEATALRNWMYAGARLRDFADGRMGAEIVSIVDVTVDHAGAVASLEMIQRSGLPTFDSWVLETLEKQSLPMLGLDAGALPAAHRSRWAFTGRIVYFRSVKDVKAAEDVPYLLVASLFGSGRFDPVLGTADYIDLRHPHYQASVKLLAVY